MTAGFICGTETYLRATMFAANMHGLMVHYLPELTISFVYVAGKIRLEKVYY